MSGFASLPEDLRKLLLNHNCLEGNIQLDTLPDMLSVLSLSNNPGLYGTKPKKLRLILKKTEMTLLPNWPPNSPDLSPIENVWSMVQELVDEYTPSNKEDIIKSVCKAWSKLPQEYMLMTRF